MAGLEKLIRRFVEQSQSISIDDVRRLLDSFGYAEKRRPGSECIFHKKGCFPINVPTVKGKQVKTFYVKRIVKILALEEYLENSERD